MTQPTQQYILDKVLDEYSDIVNKYYPNIVSGGRGYGGPNFHYRFSNFFRHYKQTPFYYTGDLKLIHWTSLTNLSSIINNNEIRLYNLINSEDIEEFSYAGQLLSLSQKQIEVIKKNYFTASFCSYDNLSNEYLWKNYGKNYEGVAISFSLIDNREDWENFFLSNVYYELDQKFSEFQSEIEVLKGKYNNGPTFITDNWRFAGFYKKDRFKSENEIRLSCIFPFTSEIDSLKYVKKELKIEKDRNRIVSYVPLKLWSDPESSYFKTLEINSLTSDTFAYIKPQLPQIKIDSIYFGKNCGLTAEEYWELHGQLLEIFQWRLGYSIDLPLNLYS
jgi:hypothetical protein